tara:strand:+ start:729 stop:893 length:165 start_codon:yes stop_codon:yes gene_type:complete
MTYKKNKSFNTYKNYIRENKIDECTVSKASSEIMLDRIGVIDEQEFPFFNFLRG